MHDHGEEVVNLGRGHWQPPRGFPAFESDDDIAP
jgi:hypothetical protein